MMTEITDTHRAVAGMLQENTGRHLLDSGGAYGRSWERNQSRLAAIESTGALEDVAEEDHAAAMWNEQPRAWPSRYGGWVTLSVFHYLSERLTYLPKLDRMFRVWCQLDGTEDPWDAGRRYYNSSATVEDFATAMVERGMFTRGGEWAGASGYTYNEDSALSQDIVWTICQLADVGYGAEEDVTRDRIERLDASPGDYVVAVSIHNGCDARGGFTDARWFLVEGGWEGVTDFFSWSDWEAWCEGSQTEREIPGQLRTDGTLADEVVHASGQWECRGGYVEQYDWATGSCEPVKTDDAWRFDEDRDIWVCSECGGAIYVDAPYVG